MSPRDLLLANIPDLLTAFADDCTPSQAYAKLTAMNSPLATMPLNSFKTTAPVVVATIKHIEKTAAEHEQELAYMIQAYNNTLEILEATLAGYQESITMAQQYGVQTSVQEHTLTDVSSVQTGIQNSVCYDLVTTDKGSQTLDNNGVQTSVQNGVCLDSSNSNIESLQTPNSAVGIQQHTPPGTNGVQEHTLDKQSGVCDGIQKHTPIDVSGVQTGVYEHTPVMTEAQVVSIVQREINKMFEAAGISVQTLYATSVYSSPNKHTPTAVSQMHDTTDATDTPAVYNGWSVNRGTDGYLRINRKLKGINKTIHIGKAWSAEKAQAKIDQFMATLDV